MEPAATLRLVRITCLGASASGKTSLINSFVNGCCPYRCTSTEKAEVYHKKVDIRDDDDIGATERPFLVEVEDTPGSERGHDDDGDAAGPLGQSYRGPPSIRKGSRVRLLADKQQLCALFRSHKPPGRLTYRPQMDAMLGREFTVKSVGKDGTYGLPSLDGSEGGIWDFPAAAVHLKTSLTLPVDTFLQLGEKPSKVFKTVLERRQYSTDLMRPFSAYERPIGSGDMDKTISRNRMGYFLCFDVSDESGESLKEVAAVCRMLKEALERRQNLRVLPIVWLVGCKADKTSLDTVVRQNTHAAHSFSEEEEVPLYITSARRHQGTQEVFHEMVRAIEHRMNLWNLGGHDGEEEGAVEGQEGGCFPQ